MGIRSKREYLEKIRKRYKNADFKKKSIILDEFCLICGYERKYAIRLLNKRLKKQRKRSGPKPKYSKKKILPVLKNLWLAMDQICSKKMVSAIPEWLPFYEKQFEVITENDKQLLLSISPATIDRILKKVRSRYKQKGMSGTKPGSLLKNQIPIKTDNWDVTKPGFMEADTVAHCGNSLQGDFVWSLTMTDIYSTWTENRAVWGKGSEGVKQAIADIESSLMFILLGFDCDNGSEFLAWHIVRYFAERDDVVQFTRSRPYHKNDNAHVEQKNWTHVRQLLGYDRFEKYELVDLINDLYKNEWSKYQNHFIPTMKLIKKERINSQIKKQHDKPRTPYQRLLDSSDLSESQKNILKSEHVKLNPFKLKKNIELKLRNIFKVVNS